MEYRIQAAAKDPTHVVDIHINDFIGDWIDDNWGFGVTSKAFIKKMQDLPESVETIRLHMNSPGGDVAAASHIANTLRDQQSTKRRTVEVLIEGAAWSAATIITSAGKPTKIADNAVVMTHNPWTVVLGDAKELRKSAEMLDKVRDSIVAAYQWKSPLAKERLLELMDEETWMDADDAIANGFADEKIEGPRAAAFVDAKRLPKQMQERLANIPEKYRDRVQALIKAADSSATAPEPIPAADLLNRDPKPSSPAPAAEDLQKVRAEAIRELCKNHKLDLAAPDFIAKGVTLEEVKTAIAEFERNENFEKVKTEAAKKSTDQAAEIAEACTQAGVPEAAAGFLKQGMTIDQVRAALADPEKLRAAAVDWNARGVKEIFDLCAAAKVPELAETFIAKNMSVEAVRARLADGDAIRGACVAAKLPHRASVYIKAGYSIAEARAELQEFIFARDQKVGEIDNTISASTLMGVKPRAPKLEIDYREIYASRRQGRDPAGELIALIKERIEPRFGRT